LQKYLKAFTHLVQEKDKSQGDALNKGFRLANGDILAYLNSDDCYAHPGVVSAAVRALLENRQIDVVYGRRRTIDAEGFFSRADPFENFDADRLKRACYLPQECVFWTRELYERAGNCIDTTLKFDVDYDLWFRFLESDAQFLAVDDFWGLFRYYPASKTGDIWRDIGYPEVKVMQEKYTGRGNTLLEMYEVHHDHTLGCDSRHYTEASWLNDWFCKTRNDLQKTLIGNAPLDMWVHADM
jgi:glycosyltransferase involved in cell wall biosynthesis